MSDTESCWDCLIVGGGPAGLTAATYLRRFHRRCIVVDAGASRARWIPESNNCPGFPAGIGGRRLLERLHARADTYAVPIVRGCVTALATDGEAFVASDGARRWRARRVLLASGVTDRLPEYAWVAQAIEKQVLRLCAVCDAYEATDRRIGVYGPLASITTHARFLATFSPHVALLPTDAGDAQASAADTDLPVLPPGELDFDGERIVHRSAAGQRTVFDAVYVYLGSSTAAQLAVALGATANAAGELQTDRHQMTSVNGVYAIGDLASGLNQIAVAFGHAAIAACHVHAELPQKRRAGAAAGAAQRTARGR